MSSGLLSWALSSLKWKAFAIFSAASGMNGLRRMAVSLMALAASPRIFLSLVAQGFFVCR